MKRSAWYFHFFISEAASCPKGKRYIFRPWTTINGKVVYAWQYGIKAFPILVDDN